MIARCSTRLPLVEIALLIAALAGRAAAAQDFVTTEEAFLRRAPRDTAAKIRVLAARETLFVRQSSVSATGWVAVRTRDGVPGWVGERLLVDLHAAAAAAGTTVAGTPDAPANAIDSTWAKPAMVTSTIKIQKGSTKVSCGPKGKGGESGKDYTNTNIHKNRADVPDTSHLVTVDAIRALNDTSLYFKNRDDWSHADSGFVIPYEGIPLTVEGFLEVIKTQSGGSGESPNCNASLERDTDWHIALVGDPSEHEERSVVVEPTPRSKRNNPGWTPARARVFAIRHQSSPSAPRDVTVPRVRITGFLMLDPVHGGLAGAPHVKGACLARHSAAECAGKSYFRATLWEIHPVTRIQVFQNGVWVDLNDVP